MEALQHTELNLDHLSSAGSEWEILFLFYLTFIFILLGLSTEHTGTWKRKKSHVMHVMVDFVL